MLHKQQHFLESSYFLAPVAAAVSSLCKTFLNFVWYWDVDKSLNPSTESVRQLSAKNTVALGLGENIKQ